MSKPTWISHRGVRDTGFTENSLSAFKLAVSQGFTWLETDLRITTDNQIALCHDPSLKRLFGKDRLVHSCTRAQLEDLKYPCGQGVLFLDQFFMEFARQRWTFDVKIETAQKVLATLRTMVSAMQDSLTVEKNITFLLWSKDDQLLAEKLFPHASFFARDDECWRAGLAIIAWLPFFGKITANKAYAVPPKLWNLSLFKSRIFRAYQKRNARVIAYLPTCNEDALAAVSAGADLILSDRLFLDQ
jgi:glycerophosphoryl diester phosphodiesterase